MSSEIRKEHINLENPQIAIEQCWRKPQYCFIDARAPSEFDQGALPGATNISLLNDEERAFIGTLYKQQGKERAIDEGFGILQPKWELLQQQLRSLPRDQELVVYCARGGMRSGVIASLLRHIGYDAKQLAGGYKRVRNWILERLESYQVPNLVVLQGVTGVGKTLVLQRLNNAIDLEGLAHHRGSMFGGIGKQPITQKQFEADLLAALDQSDSKKPLFVEGESRNIGRLTLPKTLYHQMRNARIILLEASLETRVARTYQEYIVENPRSLPELRKIVGYLGKALGKKRVQELEALFDGSEYRECIRRVLVEYYDSLYGHSIKGLSIERVLSTEDLDETASILNEME